MRGGKDHRLLQGEQRLPGQRVPQRSEAAQRARSGAQHRGLQARIARNAVWLDAVPESAAGELAGVYGSPANSVLHLISQTIWWQNPVYLRACSTIAIGSMSPPLCRVKLPYQQIIHALNRCVQ